MEISVHSQNYLTPKIDSKNSRLILSSLGEDIEKHNLTKSALGESLLKIIILSSSLALSLTIAWSSNNTIILTFSYLAISILLSQFAFIGHNAGHSAICRKRTINLMLGHYCMTIITGLTFMEWSDRHGAHHDFCKDETKDPDMQVDTAVSLTRDFVQKKTNLGRFMTKYQKYHIWFLSLFFAHSQRFLSQIGTLKNIRKYWLDVVMLLLHYSVWFVLPFFVFHIDIQKIMAAYFLPLFFLGPHLAAIFWVNHIGMPLIRNVNDFSFVEHQALTSRNISNPKYLDWFFGGLNFQIEHHLFSRVPSYRLRKMQPFVRAQLTHNALTYNSVSWIQAVKSIYNHLGQVSKCE